MPDAERGKVETKRFSFIPEEQVPIYEHNLREHEKSLANSDYVPNWATLPFDQKKLDDAQKKIIASVKRPAQAAASGSSA